MEKFSLEKWLQDKSRKIRTRDGKDVEIIYTNSPVPHHPIVGFIDKSIYTWTIDGKLIYGKEEQDKNDLFFADDEEELTEFEKAMFSFAHTMFDHLLDKTKEVDIKEWKEKLLDLARKELEANYYTKVIDDRMVFKSELHEQSLQTAYDMGKQDVLKDLPKWKKITEEEQNYLAYGYLSHDGYYLSIQELKDKLPKEE